MLAKHVMTQPVSVCQLSDNLEHAARLMWETDCGVVPVVDCDGRAVAMLTDRDVCMAAYTQGKRLCEIKVDTAMSKSIKACSPEDTLDQVERLMTEFQIRRIPVLDHEGHPVGILSLHDLAQIADKYCPGASGDLLLETAKTMAAVCAPGLREAGPRIA